ncbi:MAG: pyrrolo-quinoline quinone [Planctomycetaceae bacterium]|nr:pyrrolo-quinoline quinone [Planctomycetaceae bacterium]
MGVMKSSVLPKSLCSLVLLASFANADDALVHQWPQFRGLGGQGHSGARDLPSTWSETDNIAWKVDVPGAGNSSPVITGKQVWLTSSLDNGKRLSVLCYDRERGDLVHDIEVFSGTPRHRRNDPQRPHANPTPVIEGDRLYVHFGQHGTACLTTAGEVVWSTQLLHDPMYCPSSSPVLYKDLLIVPCCGRRHSYIAALDKQTGDVRWQRQNKGRQADSTPLLIRAGEADQLVCNLASRIVSLDPQTGKDIWSIRQRGCANVPRPLFGHGLIFVCGGYMKPDIYAIKPDGRGDVSKTHIRWQSDRSVPQNASPVIVGDELYLITDKGGIASCLDARTGEVHWRKRIGGAYYASMLVADGRIYLSSEEGRTTVIAPKTTFQELATNQIDGEIRASLAAVGKAIYLRSDSKLYRIEAK